MCQRFTVGLEGLTAAAGHARHFVAARVHEARAAAATIGRSAVMVASFDAELFGHWWFEGPEFLDVVARTCVPGSGVDLVSSAEVIFRAGALQVAMPAASSWGWGGYGETWINERNCWMWPYLGDAAAQMAVLAASTARPTNLQRRVLNQLARELVLETASDWPFMATAGPMAAYGKHRVRTHLSSFHELLGQFESVAVDPRLLAELEKIDNVFGSIDYRDFAASQAVMCAPAPPTAVPRRTRGRAGHRRGAPPVLRLHNRRLAVPGEHQVRSPSAVPRPPVSQTR